MPPVTELSGIALNGTLAKVLGVDALVIGDSSRYVRYDKEIDDALVTEEFLDILFAKTHNEPLSTLKLITVELLIEQSKYLGESEKSNEYFKMIGSLMEFVMGIIENRRKGMDVIGKYNNLKDNQPWIFQNKKIETMKKEMPAIDCSEIEIVIDNTSKGLELINGKATVSSEFLLELQEKMQDADLGELQDVVSVIISDLPNHSKKSEILCKALIKIVQTEMQRR